MRQYDRLDSCSDGTDCLPRRVDSIAGPYHDTRAASSVAAKKTSPDAAALPLRSSSQTESEHQEPCWLSGSVYRSHMPTTECSRQAATHIMATIDRGRQAGTTETYTHEQGHRRHARQMQGHHAIHEMGALDKPGDESLPASSLATLRQCQKDGWLEKCGAVSSALSIVATLWLSSGPLCAGHSELSKRLRLMARATSSSST
eukprot:852906-Prymnesium_polylepis.2